MNKMWHNEDEWRTQQRFGCNSVNLKPDRIRKMVLKDKTSIYLLHKEHRITCQGRMVHDVQGLPVFLHQGLLQHFGLHINPLRVVIFLEDVWGPQASDHACYILVVFLANLVAKLDSQWWLRGSRKTRFATALAKSNSLRLLTEYQTQIVWKGEKTETVFSGKANKRMASWNKYSNFGKTNLKGKARQKLITILWQWHSRHCALFYCTCLACRYCLAATKLVRYLK